MNDLREFWKWALRLEEPWKVSDVSYKDADGEQEVHIRIEVPTGSSVRCPVCGSVCKVHDRRERTWRDVDMRGMKTYIHASVPRSDCSMHGVRQAEVPWARPGSGFTLLMESMIVSMVRQMPVKTVGDVIGEYDGRIWTVVRTHSEKLTENLDLSELRRVAVDEKSFKGRETYITVLADADTGRMVFITDGKDSCTMEKFRQFLLEHKGDPKKITDFSCDFGSAYISGIRKHFKRARITCDRFHLVKMANKALNDTKCGELKLAVNRMKAKYLLLRNPRNMSEGDLLMREKICQDNETLGLAFRLTESLCSVYSFNNVYTAEQHLKGWIGWAKKAGLYHFKRLARTIEKHISLIIQWFSSRLTNALIEGINSLISVIKSRARGFRHTSSLASMCYIVSAQEKTDLYGRDLVSTRVRQS